MWVTESRQHFMTPCTIAHQCPLSMEFFRQECWSELPLFSPGDLPNPGIECGSHAFYADSLPSEPPGKEIWNKEGWVPKNWCFWTVVLEKTLESPLDGKGINQINFKGNQPWIFMEGLMLKLKLQSFGHLMWRDDSLEKPWCWKRLRAGGERGNRGWDDWMASLTQWTCCSR